MAQRKKAAAKRKPAARKSAPAAKRSAPAARKSSPAARKSVTKSRATGSGPKASDVRQGYTGPAPKNSGRASNKDIRRAGDLGPRKPGTGKPSPYKPMPDFATKPGGGRPGRPENDTGMPAPEPRKGVATKSTKTLKKRVARKTAAGKSATKAKAELKSRKKFGRTARRYKKSLSDK
jgi:hypothetical protein